MSWIDIYVWNYSFSLEFYKVWITIHRFRYSIFKIWEIYSILPSFKVSFSGNCNSFIFCFIYPFYHLTSYLIYCNIYLWSKILTYFFYSHLSPSLLSASLSKMQIPIILTNPRNMPTMPDLLTAESIVWRNGIAREEKI